MEILYLLIPLALILLTLAIGAFFWAVKHKQFDDMETPAHQILQSDYEIEKQKETAIKKKSK